VFKRRHQHSLFASDHKIYRNSQKTETAKTGAQIKANTNLKLTTTEVNIKSSKVLSKSQHH